MQSWWSVCGLGKPISTERAQTKWQILHVGFCVLCWLRLSDILHSTAVSERVRFQASAMTWVEKWEVQEAQCRLNLMGSGVTQLGWACSSIWCFILLSAVIQGPPRCLPGTAFPPIVSSVFMLYLAQLENTALACYRRTVPSPHSVQGTSTIVPVFSWSQLLSGLAEADMQ